MDHNALTLLVEIIDSGNLSRAAAKLKMSRANVSYHLAQLEKSVGVQLVRRTTRRVEPTEVGLRLYEHGRSIRNELAAYNELLAEKPELVVLNKIDAIDPDELKEKVKTLKKISKADVLQISGVSRQGIDQVLYAVIETLDAEKAARLEEARRKVEPNWTP